MKTTITKWVQGLQFVAKGDSGHAVVFDAYPEVGGSDTGPRPGEVLLMALGTCTGIDVVSILNKMRVPFTGFSIKVDGELTEGHPKVFHKLHVLYRLTGKELDRSKVERAVELSQTTYCGVSAMLAKSAEITTEIVLDND